MFGVPNTCIVECNIPVQATKFGFMAITIYRHRTFRTHGNDRTTYRYRIFTTRGNDRTIFFHQIIFFQK